MSLKSLALNTSRSAGFAGATSVSNCLLRPINCCLVQSCAVRDVDYFGWKISYEYLGKTLKTRKVLPVMGYSNLRTHVHRMKQRPPVDLDMQKFAMGTLTERSFAVKLPEEYTIEPLPVNRTGGRDPNTGRIAVHHRGGGKKKWFHWVDFNRLGPSEESDLEEKVLWIGRDLYRTGFLALVANGVKKRYVLAHDGMKVGDVIKSTRKIPKAFEKLKEGDAHPLGAMAPGTLVSQIEVYPRTGATKCRAAGACATVGEHMKNGMVIVQLSEKRQIVVGKDCLAVVGRLARTGPRREVIGSGARRRWMGVRPQSGWWKRKTGRFGRNLNKKKITMVYDPDKPIPKYVTRPPLACRR